MESQKENWKILAAEISDREDEGISKRELKVNMTAWYVVIGGVPLNLKKRIESLHGCICFDAYFMPWISKRELKVFFSKKYYDWNVDKGISKRELKARFNSGFLLPALMRLNLKKRIESLTLLSSEGRKESHRISKRELKGKCAADPRAWRASTQNLKKRIESRNNLSSASISSLRKNLKKRIERKNVTRNRSEVMNMRNLKKRIEREWYPNSVRSWRVFPESQKENWKITICFVFSSAR